MDSNVKEELNYSTSLCRIQFPDEMPIKSIKELNNCLCPSEICIKTESREDESEFQIFPSTSYEICPNYDIKTETDEPLIKLEYGKKKNEMIEDPLDVSKEIKGRIKTEPTEEVEDIYFGKHFLDTKKDFDSYSSRTNTRVADEEIKECLPSEPENSNKIAEIGKEKQYFVRNKQISSSRNYSCHICYKTFPWPSHLNKHLRTHINEKHFLCQICNKSFNAKGSLDRHMLFHNEEKPHVCDICKKVFNQKVHLDSHKLLHTSVKPFICSVCNKSFSHNYVLVRHERVHTGERPFSCDVCNQKFKVQAHLIIHNRRHSEKRPYSCDLCEKTFKQGSTLNKHKKLIHEK